MLVMAVAGGLFVSSGNATAAPSEATAPPAKSWKCLAGVCLGNSREALSYRHGLPVDWGKPSEDIAVKGGNLHACFWRCWDAVTEDGFEYYGGTARAGNSVLAVQTCDPIFQLPDKTKIGTRIPFGERWNGYRRILREGHQFAWEKYVRVGTSRVHVVLPVDQGRVVCVTLERAR